MENKSALAETTQAEFCNADYEQLCIDGFFDEDVAIDYEFPTER